MVAAIGLAGAVLGAGAVGAAVAWWRSAPVSTVGELAFENPLHIPPLAESTVDDDGRRVFDLELQEGQSQILPGATTTTWGFDGAHLSPTIRAERGEQVRVDVTNGVGETSTVHWHGMHLPAQADGGPHQLIEPGTTWSPSWTIDQPAATLWFHPHVHGATAEHVYRGAAGMFIVDDPEAAALDLPAEYGVDDVPVILQDRAFDDDNQLAEREPFFSNVGILGDETLVNGTHDPHLEVTTERIRLRVLNASNARTYELQLDDERPFQLVGTDGGLLPRPATLGRLLLSPGERAEIVVAMEPGQRSVLRSVTPELGLDPFQRHWSGGADSFDLLQLRAAADLEPSPEVPEVLVDLDAPSATDVDRSRTFELQDDRINGRQMDLARVDQVVEAGSTERWEVRNEHSLPHSFHPHLISFVVLEVDGRAPPPHLSGWKDTVYVPPGTTVQVLARFPDDVADPEVPYMFHCHVLRHEDAGMMGQLVVVEPGTRHPSNVDLPAGASEHDHG